MEKYSYIFIVFKHVIRGNLDFAHLQRRKRCQSTLPNLILPKVNIILTPQNTNLSQPTDYSKYRKWSIPTYRMWNEIQPNEKFLNVSCFPTENKFRFITTKLFSPTEIYHSSILPKVITVSTYRKKYLLHSCEKDCLYAWTWTLFNPAQSKFCLILAKSNVSSTELYKF